MPSRICALTAVWLALASMIAPVRAEAPGGAVRSEATPETPWDVPDIDALPDDAWGRTVRYGRDLIVNSAVLIGPENPDPSRRFAGNGLNCQNCHLEAGAKKFGVPFVGVYADFPNYRARAGAVGTIEDRVQGCMARSMNGHPLPYDGPEMVAIVAYLKFLSTGHAVGAGTPGRGPGRMPELARAADPGRGATIFAQTCVACHGDHGEGKRVGKAGDNQGYSIPPLWGKDSFNDGAGMARLITAANFIHNNMPNGANWRQPALSVEDAWDVAAFVLSQPRPHKPGLERDFPKRVEKPVDTPYGPYADSFSATQHKFGPFQPLRNAIKALAAASPHGPPANSSLSHPNPNPGADR